MTGTPPAFEFAQALRDPAFRAHAVRNGYVPGAPVAVVDQGGRPDPGCAVVAVRAPGAVHGFVFHRPDSSDDEDNTEETR